MEAISRLKNCCMQIVLAVSQGTLFGFHLPGDTRQSSRNVTGDGWFAGYYVYPNNWTVSQPATPIAEHPVWYHHIFTKGGMWYVIYLCVALLLCF